MAFKKPAFVETPRPHIECCYANCMECAVCRVWTKTGWANVCLIHYPKIEIEPRRTNSWYEMDCREAYSKSPHYRKIHGGAAPAKESVPRLDAELADMKARMALSRTPGEDDEQDQRLADAAQA